MQLFSTHHMADFMEFSIKKKSEIVDLFLWKNFSLPMRILARFNLLFVQLFSFKSTMKIAYWVWFYQILDWYTFVQLFLFRETYCCSSTKVKINSGQKEFVEALKIYDSWQSVAIFVSPAV